MDLIHLKNELSIACMRAYKRGIQTGDGGNVSTRIPGSESMLVTASGTSFVDSTPEDFIEVDFDGNIIKGEVKPTREALLHGYIYKRCPGANAIVHAHAPWCILWASTGKTSLPRTTWHSKMKLTTDIPCLDIPAAIVPTEHFDMLDDIFSKWEELDAFILVDHGLVAIANDPIRAEHLAELIEETAQIALLKKLVAPIPLL